MKRLNRKEYKKIIKEFRKTYLEAQIKHKWVYFQDKYRYPVLMYVTGSIIKRAKEKRTYTYNFDGFDFELYLQGSPVLHREYNKLEFSVYTPYSIQINGQCSYKILKGDEIKEYFYDIINDAKFWFSFKFSELYKKNEDIV